MSRKPIVRSKAADALMLRAYIPGEVAKIVCLYMTLQIGNHVCSRT